MVKSSRGSMSRKTRKLKGRTGVTVTQLVRTFNIGDKVVISPCARPAGRPHLRYSGRHGIIKEKRGNSYVVEVGDMGSKKSVIAGPVHLKLA
ncbi:MAG: 50S ribosomal protein L21e [Candidatus ainarchaeum sp.]|nr:50S ribosomal protein L21e [Candidatus ainarchaeum sp.]